MNQALGLKACLNCDFGESKAYRYDARGFKGWSVPTPCRFLGVHCSRSGPGSLQMAALADHAVVPSLHPQTRAIEQAGSDGKD